MNVASGRQPEDRHGPGAAAPVIIVGGGPVGLATALELDFHGVDSLVIEPRQSVSHARPRAKTTSARTMELFRRWGVADDVRRRAPLTADYSSDIVFCTAVTGREISRFTGTLGIGLEATGMVAEGGQQVGQPVVEEVLRDAVVASSHASLLLGRGAVSVRQDTGGAVVTIEDSGGDREELTCSYVVGADGAHSVAREAIGARYQGSPTGRSNLTIVFNSHELGPLIPHGPAVHYWVLNDAVPGVIGPMDPARDQWWAIATGRAADDIPRAAEIVRGLAGADIDVEVLGTDPWQARSLLVDRYGRGRIFLAGDSAHQNSPWGGHGFNTGVGDAVNLGWKLAAVLNGWAPEKLLDSYQAERRPISEQTIRIAARNARSVPSELRLPELTGTGSGSEEARRAAATYIQQEKRIEFHCLGLVLGYGYGRRADEQVVDESDYRPVAAAGNRLPHRRLADATSIYDRLGSELSVIGGPVAVRQLIGVAATRGIPVTHADCDASFYDAEAVLVRPDQHVAWLGDAPDNEAAAGILDMAVLGFPEPRRTQTENREQRTGDTLMPTNRATDRPIAAPKLHHTTFTTLRLDAMVEWYGLALGMYPAFHGDDAAWLTNDEANHRIALLSPPGLMHAVDKGHHTGIHHTAFEFETFDQWLNNYIRLRNHNVLPFLYLDHGITMSVYYQDPDGNGVEIQVDAFGDWRDSTQFISSALEFAENPIGTWFDPEKLVEAREQGLSFEEIHRRARAGEYLPEKIPDDIFLPEVY